MVQLVFDEKLLKGKIPFTASEKYLQSLSKISYGWFVSDLFYLPFVIEKKFIFKRLVITHECVKISSELDNHHILEKEFLNNVVDLAKRLSIDFISIPKSGVVFNTFPDKSISVPFGSYLLDLSLDEKVLFENLHSKHRNVIKKAEKDGVLIKWGHEYLSDFYPVYQDTLARQKLNYFSLNDLENMCSGVLTDHVQVFVAVKDGKVQGGAMFLFAANDSVYYLLGGSLPVPHIGSLNFLHWSAICYFKSKNVAIYDFVGARIKPQIGSKLEGIQRFKSRFGSDLRVGYLWKFPINSFKYFLYNKIASLNSFIRGRRYRGDIIDDELKNAKK